MVLFEDNIGCFGQKTSYIYCGDHKERRYLGNIHGNYIRLTDNEFDLEELEQIVAKMKENRRSPRD